MRALQRSLTVRCVRCKTLFRRRNYNSRWCSIKCKSAAGYAKTRRHKKDCGVCGRPFLAFHKHSRFCSRACGVVGRGGIRRKQQIFATCHVCAEDFRVRASRFVKVKYCSRKCSVIGGNSVGKAYDRGKRAEYAARMILESEGYYVVRSGGSKGAWDLVAYLQHPELSPKGSVSWRCVQVKKGADISKRERIFLQGLKVPMGTTREVWRFLDRVKKPIITVLEEIPIDPRTP